MLVNIGRHQNKCLELKYEGISSLDQRFQNFIWFDFSFSSQLSPYNHFYFEETSRDFPDTFETPWRREARAVRFHMLIINSEALRQGLGSARKHQNRGRGGCEGRRNWTKMSKIKVKETCPVWSESTIKVKTEQRDFILMDSFQCLVITLKISVMECVMNRSV